jgi:hypothetical protein
MTHERDLLRELDLDLDLPTPAGAPAPGRAAASASLLSNDAPIPSGILQRKARDGNGVADDAESAVAHASSDSGSALPTTLQRKFEDSLGTDLSSVRIHDGASSADAAHSVGARAYTVGNDIHFAAGEYDPGSDAGQHLLAHEVAHTVQQRGGSPTRQNKLEVSTPYDAAEHEADRAADAMVSGQAASIGTSAGGVHRQEQGKKDDKKDDKADDKKWPIDWKFGYSLLPTAGATTKGATERKPGMAAYVDNFTVAPTKQGEDAQTLGAAVNARDNGDVTLGTTQLPEAGGKVSATVRVGTPPSIKVDATVTATEKKDAGKAKVNENAAETGLKAQLASDLKAMTTGDLGKIKAQLEAKAKEFLGSKSDASFDYKLTTLSVTSNKGPDGKAMVVEAGYPAPANKGVYLAQLQVPESESGSATSKKNVENSEGSQKGNEKTSSVDTTVTTEDVRTVAKNVSTEIANAFKTQLETAISAQASSKDTISKTTAWSLGGKAFGKLGGKISAGDLGLPLGKIAKSIPILNKLTLKLGLDITGEAGGELTGAYSSSTTNASENTVTFSAEDKKTIASEASTAITTAISETVQSKVATTLATKYGFKESEVNTTGKKEVVENINVQKTITTGHPTLSITGGSG